MKRKDHGSPSIERNPNCFYKLMLFPHIQSNKLRIPEVFSRAFGDEHSGIATLTVPTRESWEVALVKEDGSLWFREGWRDFVEYFAIGFAYVLVFLYEGNSEFKVHIFSPSACEIVYPCNARKIPQEKASPSEDNDDDDISFRASNSSNDSDTEIIVLDDENDEPVEKDDDAPSDGCEVSNSMHGNQATQSVKDDNEPKSIPEESRIQIQSDGLMEALSSIGISMPKNPFFVTLIKNDHIFKSMFVRVPAEFAQRYITCSTTEHMNLEASNGKQWEVRVRRNQGTSRLGNGWIDFARENRLKVGDLCVFELTDAQNRVLKVHVGNKSQLKNEEKWRDLLKSI